MIFVGTLLAGGKVKKAVQQVKQISFSANYARKQKQEVLYITERAVFRLGEQGVELIEKAPNVDLEKDILAQMDFRPVISPKLKTMSSKLFREEVMGCFRHA